jgi:dihydroorotase
MTLDHLFDAAAKPKTEPADLITIRRPDDWHIHLRDGAMLRVDIHRRAGVLPAAVAAEDDDVVIFRGDETRPWSIGEIRP